MEGVVGLLQRKSRFYGWSRHVFCLDLQGFVQLSSERQHSTPTDKGAGRSPPSRIIGDANGIDVKGVHRQRHKQRICLQDIVRIASQGKRELVLTLPSRAIVLRASSPAERDLWLNAFKDAVFIAAASPEGDGKHTQPNCSSEIPSTDALVPPETMPLETPALPVLPLPCESSDSHDMTLPGAASGDPIGSIRSGPIGGISNNLAGWLPSLSILSDGVAGEAHNDDMYVSMLDVHISGMVMEDSAEPPTAPPEAQSAARDLPSEPAMDHAAGAFASATTNVAPSAASSASGLAGINGSWGQRLLGDLDFDVRTENFDVDEVFDNEDRDSDGDGDDNCVLGLLSRSKLHRATTRGSAPLSASDPGDPPTHESSTGPAAPLAKNSTLSIIGLVPLESQGSRAAMALSTSPVAAPKPFDALEANTPEFGDTFGSFLESLACTPAHPPSDHATPSAQRTPDLTDIATAVASTSEEGIPGGLSGARLECGGAEPATAVSLSAADIASTLLVCMGLPELDGMLSDMTRGAHVEQGQASASDTDADSDGADSRPLCHLAGNPAGDSRSVGPMRPATAKLDPPGQFGLGGCSLSKLAALAASSGRATAPHATRSDKPSRLQESLLSKYSESLGVSRTMMSTSGRAGKPRTMLGWQANVSRANDLRGMDRAAGIVQYEAKEPTDTGISKVVRNQLTIEAGQGDAGRRPAVRRVRQTMSETKVVPLKSIRLRLDESIVGGRTAAGRPQGPPARGPRYMVKGGRIEGHAGQHAPGASLEPTPASGNQVARGTGGQHGRDALGEFGEIQKRLKAAEEQKRQQQKQQLFDKDGGDGVRISDIIESRQNIPLAVQLEERRRMQQAKQLAAMNQQLELQRIDAEAKRMLAEQQQQHEQFRLRSLYPDAGCNRRHSMASAAYSVGRSDWPACASSVGGGEWHTAHDAAYSTNSAAVWQQQQQAVPYSFYSRQHSRAGTPGALGESGGHWAQHQQQPVGGRSQSQFSRAVAPSFQSAGGASHAEDRLASVAARRRPGGMLVKQPRPASQTALTEHSAGSSGSWQSHALRGPPAAMHVGAGSNYERSMATSSPVLNSGTTRRSSSLSHAGIRHPSMGSHQRALPVGGMVPPVPPLPRTHSNGHGHHGGPGSPTQTPPTYGHWARPPLSSWCAQPATAQHMGSPHAHDFVPRDAQNMQQKWAVTAARGPSLLQQLHHAQSSGILPMQRAEKELYTKGAYQNGSTPVPVRGGTGAHYLGDGNTLLIDRVHESQHTRRAFFKKMGCNYADAAPMPVFMQ